MDHVELYEPCCTIWTMLNYTCCTFHDAACVARCRSLLHVARRPLCSPTLVLFLFLYRLSHSGECSAYRRATLRLVGDLCSQLHRLCDVVNTCDGPGNSATPNNAAVAAVLVSNSKISLKTQSKPRRMCARVTLCSAITNAAVRRGI